VADKISKESQASWLFLIASVAVLSVLILEISPRWLVTNPIEYIFQNQPGKPIFVGSALSAAMTMNGVAWWLRVVIVVSMVFLVPAISLGTVSPVVAKLAVDRVRASKRTGAAIGQVYAWGMVGSILGTFLTGFFLIDIIGTKGVILLIAVMLAIAAAALGDIIHAIWAGIPLGLCMIAFVPHPFLIKQGVNFGIREEIGNPNVAQNTGDIEKEGVVPPAWIDESNYFYIRVNNRLVAAGDDAEDADSKKRTIVLDNLEHGYFTIGHPERIDYAYEYIYGLVSHRVAKAAAKDAKKEKLDDLGLRTLFFGGGAYTFPRYLQHLYKGTFADVAEIDPAITKANEMALGLGTAPSDKDIVTTWGDARAFVDKKVASIQTNPGEKYDLIFGDAFNDFSVPWHLTTKEFNDNVAKMLKPNGVYMINIIDVYESDDKVAELAERRIKKDNIQREENKLPPLNDAQKDTIRRNERANADQYTGFLGSWVETARKSFKHVYIYGTDDPPGSGLRETFVVVVTNADNLDLKELGERKDDPKFTAGNKLFTPEPFSDDHVKAVAARARGIILTDDYAPVENLLAPVAATRASDD
jgi:hypothetical protein